MTRSKEFDFTFDHFNTLRKLAHSHSGIHITDDKFEMYYARLAKRLRALNMNDFSAYIKKVKQDQNEFSEFINAITTNVTAFEREPHHFAKLKAEIEQFNKKDLSIWSAGCSSGQEPYSILINSIPVCEKRHINIKLLATDLDTNVLNKAKQGIYPLDDIRGYSDAQKKKFFFKGKGSNQGLCRIKPRLTNLIDFKQLNLFNPWHVDQTFDYIFCRNVLIYFEMPKKLEIISRFRENLKVGGILFLGHSESIPRSEEHWRNIGKNMYQLSE
ncbi:CheR family methyltransferase [Alteromonas facilis]|uniref:CheR family methyltransferase n=1 Tax=Alteromonas facilis TaxID=2048004 RepID=UPI000C28198A|nr:CheR family methyltransferase [Alteromonas facilis]